MTFNVFCAIVGLVVMTGYSATMLAGIIAYLIPGKRRDNLRKGFSLPEFIAFLCIVFALPALCGALLLDLAANR